MEIQKWEKLLLEKDEELRKCRMLLEIHNIFQYSNNSNGDLNAKQIEDNARYYFIYNFYYNFYFNFFFESSF